MKNLGIMRLLFSAMVLIILIGCGGSSSSDIPSSSTGSFTDNSSSTGNSTPRADLGTGYYIDSAVEGIDYTCGTQTGQTDKDGKFIFEKGTSCTFKLAGITLRTTLSGELIDGIEIIEDNQKVAQLLQSIDGSGNLEDGIQITDDVRKALLKALEENNSEGKLPEGSVLTNVVSSVGFDVEGVSGNVRTNEEVATHLSSSRKEKMKRLLAGKTFYAVRMIRNSSPTYYNISINEDVTSLKWTVLNAKGTSTIDIGNSESQKISLDHHGVGILGNGGVLGAGGLHFSQANEDYLYAGDYFDIAPSSKTSFRYYYNKSDADAYLDSLDFNIIPTSVTSNQAPIANAGDDKSVIVNETITLTGKGTDSDGTISSYKWTKEDEALATTAQFDYIPTTVGTDILMLIVTDDDGAVATDKIEIIVNDMNENNQAPIANAGEDKSITVNETITLTGTGSDSDGTIIHYAWGKDDTVLATTASFEYTPSVVGTDTLTLAVTDNDGDVAFDIVVITVNKLIEGNQPPVANAGDDKSVTVNQSITLTGSGTDSDGTITSYEWKEGNSVLATTASFSYIPTNVGSHTLTLTVTDDDGVTATDQVAITVNANDSDSSTNDSPTSSFVRDASQKTVVDSTTNLMWQDNEEVKTVKKVWLVDENYQKCLDNRGLKVCNDTDGDTAESYCYNLNLAGYHNWRLPTKEELKSIRLPNEEYYYENEGYFRIYREFENTSYPAQYWSITTEKDQTTYSAITIGLTLGSYDEFSLHKSNDFNVRCVRNNDLTVQNEAPKANSGEHRAVKINKLITLIGEGKDKDGTIVSYEWKKGDDTLATTAELNYTPTTLGTDILTLIVTDNDGATATDDIKLSVGIIDPNTPDLF